MALRNEVKVGILGLCSMVALFWGYHFLKGSNVFSGGVVLKAVFENVEGLQVAAPITINGYRVGAVTDIYLGKDEFAGKVVAELSLDRGTNIPKDSSSYAVLIQPSIMSGKTVELKFRGKCEGAACLGTGDRINGRVSSMFDAIKPVVDPYLEKLDSVSAAWLSLASSEKGEIQAMMKDIRATIGNMLEISSQVNNLMVSSGVNIAVTVSNLKSISEDLKGSNKEIAQTLQNVNGISKQVKDGNIDKLLKESQETIETLNKTIASLQTTIQKTNGTIDQIKKMTDFENQEGLLSMLLFDKAFAKDMKITIQDVQFLLRDIRLHPERYRTILSGKKKKYNHTELDDDPAHKK
jgi:phospholipid/cholesterol/gamma-HCH transport system substrate-binding protein